MGNPPPELEQISEAKVAARRTFLAKETRYCEERIAAFLTPPSSLAPPQSISWERIASFSDPTPSTSNTVLSLLNRLQPELRDAEFTFDSVFEDQASILLGPADGKPVTVRHLSSLVLTSIRRHTNDRAPLWHILKYLIVPSLARLEIIQYGKYDEKEHERPGYGISPGFDEWKAFRRVSNL
jgi:hypothetical protein